MHDSAARTCIERAPLAPRARLQCTAWATYTQNVLGSKKYTIYHAREHGNDCAKLFSLVVRPHVTDDAIVKPLPILGNHLALALVGPVALGARGSDYLHAAYVMLACVVPTHSWINEQALKTDVRKAVTLNRHVKKK